MTPTLLAQIAQEATISTYQLPVAFELAKTSAAFRRYVRALPEPGGRCGWCAERTGCDCLTLQFHSIPR